MAGRDWAALCSLFLEIGGLSLKGLQTIANASWCDSLEELGLYKNEMTVSDIHQIVSGRYGCLTSLSFWDSGLEDDALAVLVRSEAAFPRLKALTISHQYIDLAGLRAIANHRFETLSHVYIENTELDWNGLAALARGNFGRVEELHIRGNGLKEEDIMEMGADVRGKFPNLTRLRLRYSDDPDASAELLLLLTGRAPQL